MPVFDPQLHDQPARPKPAPPELAGKWVAWDKDEQSIVAHADTLEDLEMLLPSIASCEEVVYQHVPHPDRVFVGAHGSQ